MRIFSDELRHAFRSAFQALQAWFKDQVLSLQIDVVRIWLDIKTSPRALILILIFTAIAWWLRGVSAAIVALLFTSFTTYRWSKRLVAGMACVLLLTCPILEVFRFDGLVDRVATQSYFLLLLLIILQIRDVFSGKVDVDKGAEKPNV